MEDDSSGYPISNYVDCDKFSMSHRHFLAEITTGIEPSSYKEASCHQCWHDAMHKEVDILISNGTCTVTILPKGKKALGSKWVFRIKHNTDGPIERHRARLVTLGNHQIQGIDYTETFAPTTKMVIFRTFLAIASIKKWQLHQLDVHNAFFHGDLKEEVYMFFPPGFEAPGTNQLC